MNYSYTKHVLKRLLNSTNSILTSSFVGGYSSTYSHSKESVCFDDASTFSNDRLISPGTIYSFNLWSCLLQLVWYAFSRFLKVDNLTFNFFFCGFWVISALVIILWCWNHSFHCFLQSKKLHLGAPPVSTLFCRFTYSLLICCGAILCDTQLPISLIYYSNIMVAFMLGQLVEKFV